MLQKRFIKICVLANDITLLLSYRALTSKGIEYKITATVQGVKIRKDGRTFKVNKPIKGNVIGDTYWSNLYWLEDVYNQLFIYILICNPYAKNRHWFLYIYLESDLN